MKISYSNKTLNVKLKGEQLGRYFGKKDTPNRIQFRTVEYQIEDIEKLVSNGHTLAYQYDGNDIGDRKNCYVGTDFIIIDIDSTDLTIDEVLDKTTYKPTIIHTTLSNLTESKNNKYCYHLIYCLTETLYGEENFNYAFSHFSSGIEDIIDPKAKDCHRVIFTSNSSLPNYEYRLLGDTYSAPTIGDASNDYNKYNSNISYSLNNKGGLNNKSEFSVKKENSSSIFYSLYNMNEEERNLTNTSNSFELSRDFVYYLNKMSRKEFVCHYSTIYEYITFTPPTITNTTEDGIVYADYRGMEYYELPSLWKTNENGERERKKVEVGGRTTQLYVESNLFLLIKPSITKEHFVYEVVKDVYENYDNTDGQFNNHYILSLVENVWKNRNEFKGHPIPKKFKILRYADGKTKMSCVGIVRKLMKDESIGSVIDINLSIEENLTELRKMGIKIKKNRLVKFIKDNNLEDYIRSDKQIREDLIMNIVKTNPTASLRELADICKGQNILVSYETIRKIIGKMKKN